MDGDQRGGEILRGPALAALRGLAVAVGSCVAAAAVAVSRPGPGSVREGGTAAGAAPPQSEVS
ncbi:hypothetical protein [Dactylosporangium sp. NPDC005555]|uniref:hypothetical protein n=1 Tax=Dactylosporangium sp. NPDC005555 TaxID=3154889 RepID=UPI0033BD9ADE